MIKKIIDMEKCKGCGRCVAFCKREVLALSPGLNSRGYHPAIVVAMEKCNGCLDCTRMCPDVCISIYQTSDTAA